MIEVAIDSVEPVLDLILQLKCRLTLTSPASNSGVSLISKLGLESLVAKW